MAWLARIYARRIGKTSGRARKYSSFRNVSLRQRTARLCDSSVRPFPRVARTKSVANARFVVGGISCRPDSLL